VWAVEFNGRASWGAAVLRPYTKIEAERSAQSRAMVFGATAHPSFGQFTRENRLFRVECTVGAGVE
jgi:hypothetical protein